MEDLYLDTLQAQYSQYADEQVIEMVKNGDEKAQDYILDKYKAIVKMKSRAYFLIGSDKEDIIQEGMIGLYKAIRDYNPEKNTTFKVFAEVCMTRQIITAIKAATRKKHIPLNSYISLNKSAYDDESDTFIDLLKEDKLTNPEELFIHREDRAYIESHMEEILSPFESRVLVLYLQGKSYFEIANVTEKHVKSIDNALQRVKRKIEKLVSQKKP